MKRDGDISRASARERDSKGLARKGERRRGGRGTKDRPGVGEDQTSRRATGWSLPALLRVSSFSTAALPTKRVLTPLFFSLPATSPLSRPPRAASFSHLYYSYFHAHVPFDYVVRRSTFSPIFSGVTARPGPATGRNASRNCSTESRCIDRPTCCLGISSR